ERPCEQLVKKFGKMGQFLSNVSHGIDNRPVNNRREVKSMGEERTFEQDVTDRGLIEKKLAAWAKSLVNRLKNRTLKGKTITLKVKYHDFSSISRSRTLGFFTRDEKIITTTAFSLMSKTAIGRKAVRLVGVSLSGLTQKEEHEQLLLFEPHELCK
ncbi:MAG: DNA polymerase IV, partial [Nitrospinota bacterium]